MAMHGPDWLIARPIAHRGYHEASAGVMENTLSAFRRAVAAGFAIECDLHYAADGVPVVFHDDMLDRLCGVGGDVRARTARELAQLSVGATADRIASLADLLATVSGAVPLVIEMKGREGDDDGFAASVLEVLEDYEGPAALMSFDHWLIADLRALGCRRPLGLTADGVTEAAIAGHRAALEYEPDFLSYCVHHLPNAFTDAIRASGRPIISWTVRDEEGLRRSRRHADQMTFEGFDPDRLAMPAGRRPFH